MTASRKESVASFLSSSPTAPAGADQGLRAALQGLRREVRESWLRSLGALTPAVPGQTDPATLSDDDLAELPAGAHVLIMSHDHAEDFILCDTALRRGDLGTVGLIGSSAKWSRFRKRLRDEGHDDAAISRISCPIGVPGIPGKEPAAIAVSVAADLLRVFGEVRRTGS